MTIEKTHYRLSWEYQLRGEEIWNPVSREICVEDHPEGALEGILGQASVLKRWSDDKSEAIRKAKLEKAKSVQEDWRDCDIVV